VGRIVLLAVRVRVATVAVAVAVVMAVAVTAAAALVMLVAVAAIAAAAAAAVMAVARAAAAIGLSETEAVVLRSGSTPVRAHRSPAAARLMAIRPTATAMPGRRRDMTRAAVRATTHGVLTETAIARVTVTVGRAR
jgi:hypothetical protein